MTTNPAKLLYDILTDVRKIDGGNSVQNAWSKALGVPQTDYPALFGAIVELHGLLNDVETRVRSLPNIRIERRVSAFPAIRNALSATEWKSQWANPKSLLTDEVMTRLEFCIDDLDGHSEEVIPADVLAELLAEIQCLEELVTTTDMGVSLRIVLLDLLATARSAILNYRFRGVSGMRHAVIHSVGSIVIAVREPGAEDKKAVVDRFIEWVKKFDQVISTAGKLKPIIAPLLHFLPGSPPDNS